MTWDDKSFGDVQQAEHKISLLLKQIGLEIGDREKANPQRLTALFGEIQSFAKFGSMASSWCHE